MEAPKRNNPHPDVVFEKLSKLSPWRVSWAMGDDGSDGPESEETRNSRFYFEYDKDKDTLSRLLIRFHNEKGEAVCYASDQLVEDDNYFVREGIAKLKCAVKMISGSSQSDDEYKIVSLFIDTNKYCGCGCDPLYYFYVNFIDHDHDCDDHGPKPVFMTGHGTVGGGPGGND